MKKKCERCGKIFERQRSRKLCDTCINEIIKAIHKEPSDTCVICGKKIPQKNTGRKRKYCSLECKSKANLAQAMKKPRRAYKQKKFKEKYQKKSTGKTIDKLNAKAQKLGMDYGKYTAMLRGELKR